MTRQWLRLDPKQDHLFFGHQIDRTKPIKFEINGHKISGFAGDTVLSALLGSGVNAAGMHYGAPLALSATVGLAVKLNHTADAAYPIDRLSAYNGASYSIAEHALSNGGLSVLKKLFSGPATSLDLSFPDGQSVVQTPSPSTKASAQEYDLVVVGAGLGGLAAAARAIELGQSVAIVERRPYLGGIAALFGHAAGEEPPENAIKRLSEIVQNGGTKVVTSADVISVAAGQVTADIISGSAEQPIREIVQFNAKSIVLATGAADRLPIFPGNRLPSTIALSRLYEFASAYALWPGENTLLATTSNAGYRLALIAADADAPVDKIIDNRLEPQSRFIEFAKAYGIKFAFAERIFSASFDAKTQDLTIASELAFTDKSKRRDEMQASALILSGGWMPRLDLWQRAGGTISKDEETGQFRASGRVKNVALAGTVAGYQSSAAVMLSGQMASEAGDGRKTRAIKEHLIDPKFETPDGIFPIASSLVGANTTYLSNSASLATVHHAAARTLFAPPVKPSEVTDIEDVALSIADCLALNALDMLPDAELAIILSERMFDRQNVAPDLETLPAPSPAPNTVPPYLAARFGSKSGLWHINCDPGQAFEIGDLLYPNSDINDPELALGVVLKADMQSGTVALISGEGATEGRRVFARSVRRQLWATLATPVAKAN